MVEWALEGLKATRPDAAVEFLAMVELGKHGGDRKSETFRNQERNTNLKRSDTVARVRARLERDGKTELLGQVERGEIQLMRPAP